MSVIIDVARVLWVGVDLFLLEELREASSGGNAHVIFRCFGKASLVVYLVVHRASCAKKREKPCGFLHY